MPEGELPRISVEWAWRRVERLRTVMRERWVDVALLHEHVSVRHSAGATSPHGFPTVVVVSPERVIGIFFASEDQEAAVDEQVVLRGVRRDRPVNHARELATAAGSCLRTLLRDAERGAIGVEQPFAPGWLWQVIDEVDPGRRVVDLSVDLHRLRRRKDPDELGMIRFNVAISEAAYRAAAETVRPGLTELEVYQAMRKAAEDVAGTSVPVGGDFAVGPRGGEEGGGGPPSRRVLEKGDSFVIDFWPSFGGYWADLCRTFPVGAPRQELQTAIDLTIQALDQAASLVRPGVRAADVDRATREFLGAWPKLGGGGYFHLTGHGLGLTVHEAPWVLADSEDTFEVGDVVSFEPGLYGKSLRGGSRTEDDYLVTEQGVENLCTLPRLLA